MELATNMLSTMENTNMRTPQLIILAAGLAAAPSFAAKPQIQWNQQYDFSSISTFMWQDSPQSVSLAQAEPFLHSHIVNAIEYQLTSAGLTEVQADPDILVTYYGSTETEVQLRSNSFGYGWGGYGGGGWGYYGYGGGGLTSTTTDVVEYQVGTLVIDIIDPARNELIWRGTSSDIRINDNPEKLQKSITKAIEKMVKQSQRLRERAQ